MEVDSEEGVHDRLEGRIQETRVAQVPEARRGGGKAATLPLGSNRTVQEHIAWSRAAPIARVSRELTQRTLGSSICVVLVSRIGTSQAVLRGTGVPEESATRAGPCGRGVSADGIACRSTARLVNTTARCESGASESELSSTSWSEPVGSMSSGTDVGAGTGATGEVPRVGRGVARSWAPYGGTGGVNISGQTGDVGGKLGVGDMSGGG